MNDELKPSVGDSLVAGAVPVQAFVVSAIRPGENLAPRLGRPKRGAPSEVAPLDDARTDSHTEPVGRA